MFSLPLVRLLALLFVVLGIGAVRAAPVEDLYTARVEDDTPVERRVESALTQVLVKVSGRRDIMQRPETRTLLDNASLLQRAQSDPGRIGFDPVGLKNLMNNLGLSVLSDDRPELLVWLARGEGSGAELVEPGGEIYRQLGAAMQQRGLPLRQPLLDLTDQLALTAQDLLSGESGVVQQASARYQSDAILVGLRQGEELRWTLWWDGQTIREQSAAQPLELHRLADRLADRLLGVAEQAPDAAQRPELVLEPVGAYQPEGVELEVDGIATPAAYLDLTGWLRRQPGVSQLVTAGQSGQRLTLIVRFEGGSVALEQLLTQNPRLLLVGGRHYRWTDL